MAEPLRIMRGSPDGDLDDPYGASSPGITILNEMVKAYGFEITSEGARWSPGRIYRAFEESPFFTTVEWLTVAVPVARWGTALRSVSRGSSVVAKAYQAGRFAGRAPETPAGRLVSRFAGDEATAAAERLIHAPGRGRFFSSPATIGVDAEYMQWVDDFGGAMQAKPWERRGIAQMFAREHAIEKVFIEKEAEQAISQLGRHEPLMGVMSNLLRSGVTPTDPAARAALRSDEALAAFSRTWAWRERTHNEAFRRHMISRETWMKNHGKHDPRIYAEWERVNEAMRTAPKPPSMDISLGSAGAFAHRAEEAASGLTQLMDPRASVDALARASMRISQQGYFQDLAGSVIAKTADELAPVVRDIVTRRDTQAARMLGMTPRRAVNTEEGVRRHLDLLAGRFADLDAVGAATSDNLLRIAGREGAGWVSIEDALRLHGSEAYIERLPQALRGKWIDPAASRDIAEMFAWGQRAEGMFASVYHTLMRLFKTTHTAYSPRTGVSNWMGAAITSHWVTGGAPSFWPTQGWRHFMDDTPLYRRFLETGHASASILEETRASLRRAGKTWDPRKNATAIDFLGDAPWAQWMQKGAGKLENIYRGIDEVWKLNAWVGRRKQLLTAGHAADAAEAMASADVAKFMQTFTTSSEFGKMASELIPFASFTTEALRATKNLMIEKPHIAFFWQHAIDTMSHTFGAMAGFSEDELNAALEALPSYMNNKKLMALPFRVEGRPLFLDFSQMLPLANLVEAEQAHKSFFTTLYDPTTNPLIALAGAAVTGIDPFTQAEIQPRFTERQLGIPVESEGARRVVGLGEYMLRLFTPPLSPWGYAGTNLLEVARGQVNPATLAPMEPSVIQTVASNLAGMRTYTPSLGSLVQNERAAAREHSDRTSEEWNRYEVALANGDAPQMERSRQNLLALRIEAGDTPEEAQEHVARSAKLHTSTAATLSRETIARILERARSLGPVTQDERKLHAAMVAKLHGERGGHKEDQER